MDLKLQKKRALVCAASRGLGRAVAESLAREGCSVLICGRDEASLLQAAVELRKHSQELVETFAIDLSSADAVGKLKERAFATMGGVDILINNVGGPNPSPAASTSLEAWEVGFRQLFLSAVRLTQSLLPEMQEQRFGRIVTITSLSVVEPIDHLAVSTTMRAAVTTFSKTLATEVAARGVTVNTVMPGVIRTGRIEDLRRATAARNGTTMESEIAKTEAQIPMGRLGRPEEFASLVTYLCSPLASYITGANIPVDGGMRKSW